MKFAENNRISHRQLYRQMVLAFLAPFLLCLPGENRVTGISGIVGVAAAMVLLVIYSFFLRRLTPWYTDPVKTFGAAGGRIIGAFFLSYVALTGAYLLDLMEELVPAVLITGIPGIVISFLAAAVCSFGTHKGMQRRGRMAEVSGGVLLGGVLLMMVLCLWQITPEYFTEMTEAFVLQGKEVLKSCYGILAAFSGIGLLPFLLKDVEKRGTAGKPVVLGIVTLGGILMGMLVLIPSVLGWQRFRNEAYPVLPLLAGADLPGNVLARFDVLWMGFLLYSLLFALGSLFHYGHRILDRIRMGSGKLWLPAVIFGLSLIKFQGMGIRQIFDFYLSRIFVPGLLLIQVFMALRGNRRRQKKVALAAGLCFVVFFSGCAAIEPEKRMYPLALGVNSEDPGFSLIYGMPDLPQATGQDKQEESGNETVLSLTGSDFYEIERIYDRSQEKYLDMSHLQVIIMGDRLLEGDGWKIFMEYLKEEPFVGENVYIFRTEDPEAVLSRESGGTSAGEYLTGLLENRLPSQQKDGVTLRQVYHQWYESGSFPEIPRIIMKDGELQVYLEKS